jgi:hypothetical protein
MINSTAGKTRAAPKLTMVGGQDAIDPTRLGHSLDLPSAQNAPTCAIFPEGKHFTSGERAL